MAELIRNPEMMEKAQEEIKQVLGKDKQIQESDIINLPYLQAIIKETLRLHPPTVFLLPRKADTDVELYGYIVPKDAQIKYLLTYGLLEEILMHGKMLIFFRPKDL